MTIINIALSIFLHKEKWVVNVSQRTLGPVEITALEKGFNFSIPPKKIPVAKILSSVENGIFSLKQSVKDTIRVSVANILKNCKVPATVNITKEQEKALDNLRKDETVKILPADKGRSIVVMDSDECKENIALLLNDTTTYLKLTDKRLNPTTKLKKILTKFHLTSRTRTMVQHRNLAQIYTGNCTAVTRHQHLFTVFRKFTNLEGHCDPSQTVSVVRRMQCPNIWFQSCRL